MGVHGMDARTGFTTPNLLEAETDRALVETGSRLVVVADHTKWGIIGISSFARLDPRRCARLGCRAARRRERTPSGQRSRARARGCGRRPCARSPREPTSSGSTPDRPAPPIRPVARRMGARVRGTDRTAVAGRDRRPRPPRRPDLRPDVLPVPGQRPANGQHNPAYDTTFVFTTTSPRCGRTTDDSRFAEGLLRAEGERGTCRVLLLLAAP